MLADHKHCKKQMPSAQERRSLKIIIDCVSFFNASAISGFDYLARGGISIPRDGAHMI